MELELGLKVTHSRDDLTSTTDLRVTKDPSGPLFVSKEIDTMYILEGHLKGARRENIDIDINKYGNRITISGKKPVQEIVLRGWIMHKTEAVVRMFKKSFRIPDGVILDKIRAKFNDETSTLTIRMPKRVKGISGVGIEEVDEEEVDRGRLESTQTVVDKVPETESPNEEALRETEKPQLQETLEDSGQVVEKAIDQGQSEAAKIPERDDNKGTVKEKPEEVESRNLEDAAEAEHERVLEPVRKESEEPEVKSEEDNDQVVEKPRGRPESELQGATEKEEIPNRKETPSTQPKEEAERETHSSQTAEKPPTEETRTEKIPEESVSEKGQEERVHVPESIQSTKSTESEFPSSSSTQIEEKHEKPEELLKKEPCAEDQQLNKSEPYQEPNADDQTIKKEAHGEDQTQADDTIETPTRKENLSQEKVDGHECQEVVKQKSLSEEASQGKKPVPRKSKVSTPIVIAGSAFIVSIIVLVIHFIRAKKR